MLMQYPARPSASDRRTTEAAFAVLRRPTAHISDANRDLDLMGHLALTEGAFSARVSQEPDGSVCIITVDASEGSGDACDQAQTAAEKGIMDLSAGVGSQTRITVLVPDGVTTVVARVGTGTESIPVLNNVASAVVNDFHSVSFAPPDGAPPVTWAAPPSSMG